MPKINVYLPDDLADSVKDMNIPVSAICQRALEGSVKRIIAIRALTVEDLRRDSFPQFTDRAWKVLRLAAERAGEGGIGTGHLLGGIVGEGGNLALDVLRAIDITPEGLPSFPPADTGRPGFADDAASALELAVTESIALGHNYVGCEHLLLGIVAEPDGPGGEELRRLGADLKGTRRAVQTALAGIVHLKKQQQTAAPDAAKVLEQIMVRLARLEQHAGIG
jgi:hypothetical protein